MKTRLLAALTVATLVSFWGVCMVAADDPTTDPGWAQVLPIVPPGDTRNCAQTIAHCTSFSSLFCDPTAGDGILDHCTLNNNQVGAAGVELVDDRPLGKCQQPPEGQGAGCGEITNPQCARVRLFGTRAYIGPTPPTPDDLANRANWKCEDPKCYKVIIQIGSYCLA
jgi:hypothetical protein